MASHTHSQSSHHTRGSRVSHSHSHTSSRSSAHVSLHSSVHSKIRVAAREKELALARHHLQWEQSVRVQIEVLEDQLLLAQRTRGELALKEKGLEL